MKWNSLGFVDGVGLQSLCHLTTLETRVKDREEILRRQQALHYVCRLASLLTNRR